MTSPTLTEVQTLPKFDNYCGGNTSRISYEATPNGDHRSPVRLAPCATPVLSDKTCSGWRHTWLQVRVLLRSNSRTRRRSPKPKMIMTGSSDFFLFKHCSSCQRNDSQNQKKKAGIQRASILMHANPERDLNRIHVDGNQSGRGACLKSTASTCTSCLTLIASPNT